MRPTLIIKKDSNCNKYCDSVIDHEGQNFKGFLENVCLHTSG